jgi:abortive infection bacteriophage resistance protein
MVVVSTRPSRIKHGFPQNTSFLTHVSWYPLSGFTRRCVLIFQLIVFDAEFNSLSNGSSFEKVIKHTLQFCSNY